MENDGVDVIGSLSSASYGEVDMGRERVGRIVMSCIQGPVAVYALVQFARLVRFSGCCTHSMRLKKVFHAVCYFLHSYTHPRLFCFPSRKQKGKKHLDSQLTNA